MVVPLISRPVAGFSLHPPEILQTHDLAVGYGGKTPRLIVGGIDIGLRAGELVCLIGPNGAGKSTLIRTLAGMQAPLRGSVTLMGADVHQLEARELARRVSVVLTERITPGLLTARTLVGLGRHPYTDWTGRLSERDEAAVARAIEAVGASALAERQVGELSDGERQKIMIARALAQEPTLMILDEPTAFLDLPRRAEVMQLLRRLAHDHDRAILMSTHDLDLALRSADRIWLMANAAEGCAGTLQAGAPEDLVLSGAFEAAFRAEGITFDAQTGAFRVANDARGRISVVGDGLPAVWTRRALERAGFAVISSATEGCTGAALARVEVEGGRWHLSSADGIGEYATIAALVEAVQQLSG